MKNEKILNAIGRISDDLIEEAEITAQTGKGKFPWKALIAAAACACLILTALLAIPEKSTVLYGEVSFLTADRLADTTLSGEAFKYIAGTSNPGTDAQPPGAPPAFEFQHGYIHVVAKAVEELGTYETMLQYGSTAIRKYRVFAMEVIDPLESGMEGSFYYLLPEKLKGDLTGYDALLISMRQLPKNSVLRKEGKLTTFEYLFCDPQKAPELGNIIAFTDGVFDESLWQDKSWYFGYQFARYHLDENDTGLLVSRGSTLKEALQRRQAQIDEGEDWYNYGPVKHYDFQTEEARQLMAYVKPFENGIFAPELYFSDYQIRRYINGCPTSEWYAVDCENEKVTVSEYRFEAEDFEKLPDIPAYIAELDLTQIAPQHTDVTGKELVYNHAAGWYEKTENGVYAIVRIAWEYWDAFEQDNFYVEYSYYDETFILLDETGDHIVSREELLALIGENWNISEKEYGVGKAIPT